MKADNEHGETKAENLDIIRISDLAVSCIIGINQEERIVAQDVVINIALYADLHRPCVSDSIEDTIDYKALKKQVIDMVRGSSFFLIEKLAEEIARICLAPSLVERVTVTVDKPHALRYARSVSVQITRERSGS
jgi:D-erythro-7,8-dihydroneopterin triphosphate epimerase